MLSFFIYKFKKEEASFPCQPRSLTLPQPQARSVYSIGRLKKTLLNGNRYFSKCCNQEKCSSLRLRERERPEQEREKGYLHLY